MTVEGPTPTISALTLFHHIPRTSGNHFLEWLSRSAPHLKTFGTGLPPTPEVIEHVRTLMPGALLHGHLIFGSHVEFDLQRPYFTILRPGPQRLLSEFLWQTQRFPKNDLSARIDLLDRYVSLYRQCNHQCYTLAHTPDAKLIMDAHATPFDDFGMAPEEVFDRATNALNNLFCFIGSTEHYPAIIDFAVDRFGAVPSITPGFRNEAPGRHELTWEAVPRRIQRRIEQLTEWDQVLYERFHQGQYVALSQPVSYTSRSAGSDVVSVQSVKAGSRPAGSGPLLTILIPTWNRAERVRTLVSSLLTVVEEAAGDIELIVSNNCSSDHTAEVLAEFDSKYLRIIERTEHLPTAEEHVFESVSVCNGEYILFHGDDDIPILSTFKVMLPLLETNRYDFLTFNSIIIDHNGGATGGRLARMNGDIVEMEFVTGALSLGFTFGFAGFSNAVQRRSKIAAVDWRDIVKHAQIYAHVAWWMKAFNGGRIGIVNSPLVLYRVDDPEKTKVHFETHALKKDVGSFSFWSIGVVSLLKYLEDTGILTAEQIRNSWDFRRDGTYFRFLDNIMYMIQTQVDRGVRDGHGRNRVSGADVQFMTDWVMHIDPGYQESVRLILDMHALRPEPENDPLPRGYIESSYSKDVHETELDPRLVRLKEVFFILMNHRIFNNNKFISMIAQYHGYSIYLHHLGLVAFHDERTRDPQDLLRWLDIHPKDDAVIVADTLDGIMAGIDKVLRANKRSPIRADLAHIRADMAQLINATTHVGASLNAGLGTVGNTLANLSTGTQYENAVRALLDATSPAVQRSLLVRMVDGLRGRRTPTSLLGFDRNYYIQHNPDIGRQDPLRHFMTVGWKESRNPSAHFNMQGYLNANPDVAAAGANPLIHFLEYGRREGRKGWH